MTDSRLLPFRRLRAQRLRLSVDKTRNVIGFVETLLYVVIGVLLVAAGGLIVADTISGVIAGAMGEATTSELGLRPLDRVLLLLIVAELLFTLQLVTRAARSRPSRFCLSGSSPSCAASS